MRALFVVALGACNQWYGIGDTRLRDGPEAPGPDAPFSCPPIGSTPAFSGTVQLAMNRPCEAIAGHASGLLTAACNDTRRVESGPFAGPLEPIAGTPDRYIDGGYYTEPKLSGDSDVLTVRWVSFGSAAVEIRSYVLQAGTFSPGPTLMTGMYNLKASAITQGPNKRMLVITDDGKALQEMRFDGSTWVANGAPYALASGNVQDLNYVQLFNDGLRMTYAASTAAAVAVFYSDRASIADRFRTPVELVGVPPLRGQDPYLTEDCGRVYVTDVTAIYYTQQIAGP